jgi:hypothetical protein
VDPFDDGYLLERLVDSVRLTDANTQLMIDSVRSVLNSESESPMDGAEGAEDRAEGADPERKESAKRAASAASSAKTEEDKEADKGGIKFGKGAHA